MLPPIAMPPYELKERTRLFALAVVQFCRRLPKTDEAREAARQLRRAANSVRSNYRASRNGRSRDEFASRLAEAYEEADECRDWLEYLADAEIRSCPELLEEARALTRILAASLRTTRLNSARLKQLRQKTTARK
jgi:four helix bundle protein